MSDSDEALRAAAQAAAQEPADQAPASQPGITRNDLFEQNALAQRKIGKLEAQLEAATAVNPNDLPPARKGPGFTGLDAPNATSDAERRNNPLLWSAEDIAVYRKDGSFLKKTEAWRRSLPGGAGGLFPAKSGKSRK